MSRSTPGNGPSGPAVIAFAESQDEPPDAALACFMCAGRPGSISTPHGLTCIPCVQFCVRLVVRRCQEALRQTEGFAGHG